jgi:hypothetical protein
MADNKLYVQAGKSVTSKRGILGEGTEVSSKDFKGEKSVEALIARGTIGKEKPDLRTKAEIVKEREEEKLAKKNKKATDKKAGGAEKK